MLDNILKKLKTDRNTFFAYILLLITMYIALDRFIEFLFYVIKGVGSSYWGPIEYAIVFLLPAAGYTLFGASKMAKSNETKVNYFYMYTGLFFFLVIAMFAQLVNQVLWMIFMSIPKFLSVVQAEPELLRPAVSSITVYIAVMVVWPLVPWLINRVHDSYFAKESIGFFFGVSLAKDKIEKGPYTCEVVICNDKDKGKKVTIPENVRFENMLIGGGTGMGKTATVIEPMIAMDLEKKYFFKEASKQIGHDILKAGAGTLNVPYSNEYLNENFNLSMIMPKEGKSEEYTKFAKKMILYIDKDKSTITFKNIGMTYIAPDTASFNRMKDVANNLGIKPYIVDPEDPNSVGLNPFILEDPDAVAATLSSVLDGLKAVESLSRYAAIYTNLGKQAVENIAILLKLMYPKLHEGKSPTLEDVLFCLNDFDSVQKYCEELKKSKVLSEKYSLLISYFHKYFYNPVNLSDYDIEGFDRNSSEGFDKFLAPTVNQIDNLLRNPSLKRIICNKNNNIDLDKALENGDVIFFAPQKGVLGNAARSFGIFFLLSLQRSILRRPGNEKSFIPHFIYIDELYDFSYIAVEQCFTSFRKYKCGTVAAIQNLGQLETSPNTDMGTMTFKQLVFANSRTKLVFGGLNPEDTKYWQDEFGNFNTYWHKKPNYTLETDEIKTTVWDGDKEVFKHYKIQQQAFKKCKYKTKDYKGKIIWGSGETDFLAEKYKNKFEIKNFDFGKYNKPVDADGDEEIKHFDEINQESIDIISKIKISPAETDMLANGDPIKYNISSGDGLSGNELNVTIKKKEDKK